MSKKVKALISALVIALLLTLGGAAIVMADEGTPPPEEGPKGFLERVADILDIEKEDLINAFRQARQEMREEAFTRALNKAVENGYITQEEADEIEEWWEQKPETLKPALLRRAPRFFPHRPRICHGFREWHCPRPPAPAD